MAYTETELQLPAEIDSLYDAYSPMLYGIALYLFKTEQHAEELTADTFVSIYHNKSLYNHPSPYLALIKVLIRIARAQSGILPAQPMFRLKHFEKLPMLNMLLCLQLSLTDLCKINQLTRPQIAKKLRQELMWLRNMNHPKATMWVA